MVARAGSGLAKGVGVIASVLALLVAHPATARSPKPRPAHPAKTMLADPIAFGAFTPAAADPKLAAAFARSGLGTGNFSGGAFRFTPAGGNSRRAVTVAVRARAVSRVDAGKAMAIPADVAPSAYSLGMSLGWKRFAISGDVSKITPGILPEGREAADIGLSYSGRRWGTKLELAADRASGDRLPMFGLDQSWSVDVGGRYAVTSNIDVTGGLRYRERRTQFGSTLEQDRRDSQAVYVGTAFRF